MPVGVTPASVPIIPLPGIRPALVSQRRRWQNGEGATCYVPAGRKLTFPAPCSACTISCAVSSGVVRTFR
jgi:hypothetical protein